MSVSLRCQGANPKGARRRCDGHCGNHPIPPGYVARFKGMLEHCPEPDGTLVVQCSRCLRWARWEIVLASGASDAKAVA